MKFLKYIIGILIVLLFFGNGKAQFYNGSQMSFGKNRVQYKEFFWTYYKFDNYDIYFYLGGKELALYTANYVDEHLDEIEDKLDTGLDDKIQFIVYNNLTDLKQSNIGLVNDQSYNTGGVTHIIGKKVFLYFDGTHENFDRQIRSGIAQSIVNQLLYGTSIGSQIKNTSLFPFPDWYMNGLVSYMSEDWSTEIDNWVKDGIESGKYDKFNQLTGQEATYAGHSFWKYIAEKYGESTISNIIYMAKVSRRLESGFLYILGISYKNLQSQALDFYRELYGTNDETREYPQASLLKKVKPQVAYSRLKLSPDGNHIAYTSNWSGQYRVFLQNVNTGKKKRLMKSGFRLEDKVDYSYPLLAWHPSGKILAILIEKKGEVYMYYYMPDEKKFEKVILYQFEKVLDMSYSDDGRSLVMSAVQKGQSDIFVYDIGSNSYDQITKDLNDDMYPRFINNSKEIIFSSNRISDTIRFEDKFDTPEFQKRYDLFLYKYEDRDNILRRVTKTPLANEIQPMEYENKYITYLSDENGIYNRFIGRFDSTISYVDTTTHYRYFTNSFAVTNYTRNILEHDVVPEAYKYAQVLYKDRKYFMQIYDQLPTESLEPTKLENTPYMDELVKLAGVRTDQSPSVKPVIISEAPQVKSKGFSTVKQSDAIREIQRDIITDTVDDGEKIDINNYQFGTDDISTEDIKNWDYTLLDVPLPDKEKKDTPPKRLNYNVEYFISQIVTQIDFSYLNQTYQPYTGGNSPIFLNPGFNGLFKIGVTDLLEDYRITGGVRLSLNLVGNEYLLSYANLKKRLDKEIIFHRNSVESYDPYYAILRVYTHELFYVVKYPFNPVMALKGTASFRNDLAVHLSTDVVNLARPNLYRNLVGVKGEFIFDNTKNLGVNLFHGTRFKVFGEFTQWVDSKSDNMVVVGFDVRNYQRIHRTLIWANRFAYSSSFGSNNLIYYMGGVDNWLFPVFNLATPVDQNQNYAFQTLATNMRGFDQNIRNGNSFMVFNSELRFPVFRYFANKPIKSDFLNSFQIVGFGDIGTAWTGLHPYSEENYLFTNTIEQPPLNITVKLQKDPIVGGFGFGARTRLLGYFIRADIAWGVEDLVVQPSVFYLSLSLDF